MKLYTEEQVINTVNAIQIYIEKFGKDDAQPTIKNHLKMLGPIELPSDEEIEKGANINSQNIQQHMGFIIGVEWLKKEILNQNK